MNSSFSIKHKWLENQKKFTDAKNNLIVYVGRMRKEKGIFSLINILKIKKIFNLLSLEKKKINLNLHENIKYVKIVKNQNKLINLYDEHKIFILPSFTEGQPMALLEFYLRIRPVIIFNEIDHVIQNRVGIFISDRNYESLKKTIRHIDDNYEEYSRVNEKKQITNF